MFLKHLRSSIIVIFLFTVLTGVLYPLAVTGIAQLMFPGKANGCLIQKDGKTLGFDLIGQPFSDPKYFWSRPSATSPFAYNAGASSGSNYGMRRLLQISLEAAGYKVYTASSGKEGLQQIAMARPETVILDLGLPDEDGIEVLKKIREWTTIPVIILSVRASEQDIVSALDAGADDYLTKPFRTGELLARVRASLRHHQTTAQGEVFACGNLSVDLAARVVKKEDEFVKLTPTEYSLLSLFVRNAGKVLTHRYILQQVWDPPSRKNLNTRGSTWASSGRNSKTILPIQNSSSPNQGSATGWQSKVDSDGRISFNPDNPPIVFEKFNTLFQPPPSNVLLDL